MNLTGMFKAEYLPYL